MAENSKIEWTDHTVNLWWGCAKVHTGCKNCYAETLSDRFKPGLWGEKAKREMKKNCFKDLNKYQKKSKELGKKSIVFIGSMMDIFEDSKELINPTETIEHTGDLRLFLFESISENQYPDLIFLFLTKRPENISKMIPQDWKKMSPKNVWFGTSISDQQTADQLIPELITHTPTYANRFLSIEPQVGFISLDEKIMWIDWVIQGGESGRNKRPFNVQWAEQIRDECKMAEVPYFFKQIDKVQNIPESLMIRELPKF